MDLLYKKSLHCTDVRQNYKIHVMLLLKKVVLVCDTENETTPSEEREAAGAEQR